MSVAYINTAPTSLHVKMLDCRHLMCEGVKNIYINICISLDISIKELAALLQDIIGFKGKLVLNTDNLDRTIIKLTDPSKLDAFG